MGLFESLQKEYIDARKRKAKFATNVLSMLISDLKYEKINRKLDKLEDTDIIAFIQKTIKQKKDVIIEYKKADRLDLVEKEEKEIEFLSEYLPDMMSESELLDIVKSAMESTGAVSPTDIGKIMKVVMPEVKGKADGSIVRKLAMDMLSG